MNTQHKQLQNKIRKVCFQWKKLIVISGLSKSFLSALVVFAALIGMDMLLELPQLVRLVLLGLGVVFSLVMIYIELIRPLLHVPSKTTLARYLEERYPQLEDRLVTAIELGERKDPRISHKLLEKLFDDTRYHIEPIDLPKSLRSQGAVLWSSLTLVAVALLGGFIFSHVHEFDLNLHRIFSPWKYPNLQKQPQLLVSPGNKRLQIGSSQEIIAELQAFDAEEVALYFSESDTGWQKVQMDATTERGRYAFSFFDLGHEVQYYVKAGDLLSDIYKITTFDAPVVKQVDLTYRYPGATGLKPRQESDSGDIWAPVGTRVQIRVLSSKPLSEGRLVLENGKALPSKVVRDSVVTASLTVSADTYYAIHLTDRDGLNNSPPPEYFIHTIPDQPPELTIERPGRDIKASMVEEVPVRLKVEDDFGQPSVQLVYSVNDSPEQKKSLELRRRTQDAPREIGDIRSFETEYLFYLEDFGVLPGDFISYYFQAQDASAGSEEAAAATDMYFIEVRPFEMEFTRALSQGQGGGPGSFSGKLSQTQLEIIIATWKLRRQKKTLQQETAENNLQIIVDSQKNLQEVTQSTLFQMQQRNILSRESGGDVAKYYEQALEAMAGALTRLAEGQLSEAEVSEKTSLQNLLRAEAQITKMQLQQGQAAGANQNASLDELAELFENEMDKLKNKYETLNDTVKRNQDEEVNKTLQKIKELARRQQDFNRRMRELARQNIQPEEKKRQIEELRREQENIRRQTQELSRQMRNNASLSSSLPRQIQDQLRRATQDMNRASNNLRRNNPEIAAAKGGQALNKLKQLEDALNRNQKDSLRKRVQELQQQFRELAQNQKHLTDDVGSLARKQQLSEGELQALKERKSNLKEKLTRAQSQLKTSARQAQDAQSALSRELLKLEKQVSAADLQRKIDRAEKLLEQKRSNSALQAERDILKQLDKMHGELTRLQNELAESKEEKLDLALNQMRTLRENLESLQRQAGEAPQRNSGGRPTEGQQQSGGENSSSVQAGPGESRQKQQTLDPTKIDWMNEQLARTQKDLELLQQAISVDTAFTRETGQIRENLQGVVRTFAAGNPFKVDILEDKVLEPLRGMEAEIARQLELLQNKEKLFLAREEKVPQKYRELVEKYYEALSRTGKQN